MHVISALLASVLWGTADFLGGAVSRRLPVATVVGASQLVALIGLLPLAAALGAFDEPTTYLVPGLFAGVAGLLALTAFYRALALGTMGVVAPIAALGVVVPVAVGLLQGERPGAVRLAGILVGIVGVVLASGPELSGGAGARPLLLAVVAGLGFGAVLVLLAEGSEGGSTATVVMTLLTMRTASVALLVLALGGGALRTAIRPAAEVGRATVGSPPVEPSSSGGRASVGSAPDGRPSVGAAAAAGAGQSAEAPRPLRVTRADLPVLVVIGAFDVGANGAFAVASQGALVSVTSVLASLYPVVTVLLARRFLAERLAGAQAAGVALALAGVALLAAG